jgi:HD-GYP domain-containing protein (c-di-GMP phosphodiesterase class II)
VFLVVVALVGAGAWAFIYLQDGSVVAAGAAIGLVILAAVIAVLGRRAGRHAAAPVLGVQLATNGGPASVPSALVTGASIAHEPDRVFKLSAPVRGPDPLFEVSARVREPDRVVRASEPVHGSERVLEVPTDVAEPDAVVRASEPMDGSERVLEVPADVPEPARVAEAPEPVPEPHPMVEALQPMDEPRRMAGSLDPTNEPQPEEASAVTEVEPSNGPVGGAPEEPDVGPDGATPVSGIRTPFSVQPAVVLMSFYDAVSRRFDTYSAHLWLEDRSTDTLRLVAAFGPRVPGSNPVAIADPILGASARTRTAVLGRVEREGVEAPADSTWRYAVPVGTPEVRGVAAVDIKSAIEPSAILLNEVSGVLRGSLTAALAVHVARSEMDAAVLLLQAAQDLASGMSGEEVLTTALDRAMEMSGASTGSIMLPRGAAGALRIVTSRGLPSDVVSATSVGANEGIAGTVYTSAAPLLVEDLPGRSGNRRHGVISAVSVPIADGQGSLGVINVGSRAFPARLTDAYVRALGILGAQTAVAMRNADAAQRSWDLYLENLQVLASALESDDPFRRGASRRTARLSVALGEALGIEGEELVSLRIAAILHDVGMGLATGSVGATDRPLSTVDRGLVRAHPKVASDVMLQVPSLEGLAPVVRHHHERFDGDGYDTGLAGASIPLGSRILAVVDSFVAMTSPRPYRDPLTFADALEELDRAAGTQFDPVVVEAFVALIAEDPGQAASDPPPVS